MESNKTADQLRLLADQVESEIYSPDFALVILRGDNDDVMHTHRALENPFGVIGAIEMVKRQILQEID